MADLGDFCVILSSNLCGFVAKILIYGTDLS